MKAQEIINQAGEVGTTERLQQIAKMDLGERSLAANRVILKRAERLSKQIKISFQ